MATVAKPSAPIRQIGTPPMVPRIAPREDLNPFRIAQIQFDMAAEFLKLDPVDLVFKKCQVGKGG